MTLTLRALSLNDQPLKQPITAHFDSSGGTIGRTEQNTLALPDPDRHISRHQATISVTASGYVIRNVGSANPLVVRGRALGQGDSATLMQGDRLRIGGYTLVVVDDRADDSAVQTITRPHTLADFGVPERPDAAAPLTASDFAPPPGAGAGSRTPQAARVPVPERFRGESTTFGATVPSDYLYSEPLAASKSPPLRALPARGSARDEGRAPFDLPATADSAPTPPAAAQPASFDPFVPHAVPAAQSGGPSLTQGEGSDQDALAAFIAEASRSASSANVSAPLDPNVLPGDRGARPAPDAARAPVPAPPVAMTTDAVRDLAGGIIGPSATLLAALDDVLDAFAPDALEDTLRVMSALDKLPPMDRKARLWELYREHFENIRNEARDHFQHRLGEAFAAAGEQATESLEDAPPKPA